MQPGQTNNPNGRPKGSLNKKNQELQDLAKELGCDPAKILMMFAMGDFEGLGLQEIEERKDKEGKIISNLTISPELRKQSATDLMPYLYGKRKPIDSNGDDSSDPITELVNAFRNRE